MPLRGGGVGRLMANAILNFHFDFLHPSLIPNLQDCPSIIISIKVKDLGLAGVTLFSINSENEEYRGELARRVAEELYL